MVSRFCWCVKTTVLTLCNYSFVPTLFIPIMVYMYMSLSVRVFSFRILAFSWRSNSYRVSCWSKPWATRKSRIKRHTLMCVKWNILFFIVTEHQLRYTYALVQNLPNVTSWLACAHTDWIVCRFVSKPSSAVTRRWRTLFDWAILTSSRRVVWHSGTSVYRCYRATCVRVCADRSRLWPTRCKTSAGTWMRLNHVQPLC